MIVIETRSSDLVDSIAFQVDHSQKTRPKTTSQYRVTSPFVTHFSSEQDRLWAGQHPRSQRDALAAAGCDRVFIDKASGKLDRRPELDEALDYPRPGDTFVITRLSRAARSLRHLLDLAADLRGREVDLLVLKQGIDTSTPDWAPAVPHVRRVR
ncbi:recombinase family protein [Nonomuraea sp. NPDC049269]|uniref:recombinase family protein n=1 Tax=Nonomuraea sp. NPDC049269 TaxID=3364349 RepID=UPI00371147E4